MLKLTVRFDGESATQFSPVEKMIVDALIHIKADTDLFHWIQEIGGAAFASPHRKREFAVEHLPVLQAWVDERFPDAGILLSVSFVDESEATPR